MEHTCDFLIQNDLRLALANEAQQAHSLALQPPLVAAVDQSKQRLVVPLQGLQPGGTRCQRQGLCMYGCATMGHHS